MAGSSSRMGDLFHDGGKKNDGGRQKEPLTKSLEKNTDRFKEIFLFPQNVDFVIRPLYIRALDANGALVFMNGTTDEWQIQEYIIRPLFGRNMDDSRRLNLKDLMTKIILVDDLTAVSNFDEAKDDIIAGQTILIIDGYSECLVLKSAGFDHRNVEKTENENVVRGPHEAFVETSSVNRSLIRKQVKNEKLITENIVVGSKALSHVFIMYIQDIVDTELLNEVKKRISAIQADWIQNASILEQEIEDRPYSIIPSILYTERPDRAGAFLLEGHIVLLMENSSSCLVVPVTFWSFFHSPEDMYQRWAYGNFTRLVRLFAYFVGLLTPSIYVAVVSYHVELIPTDLLLAIAATREILPMPIILEVLIMEAAFELLREAGVRIPTPMGPTIGIVGALILGQAAVQANVVSPIMVIVIAVTGLASFAIADVSFNYVVRMSRFLFLCAAASFGIYGLGLCFTVYMAYIISLKSFGVPFFAPVAPHYRSSKDTLFRPPVWKQFVRPVYLSPKDNMRKKRPGGGKLQ